VQATPLLHPQPDIGILTIFLGSISTERFIDWLSGSVLEADCIPEAESTTCERIYQHPEWKGWATLGYPNTLLLTGVQGEAQSLLLLRQF
jgi:hypothetical protein